MMAKPAGFFQGTEMPNAGWWEALWPDPESVLAKVGVKSGMDVIDLCSGDGWFTLQIAKFAQLVVATDIDPVLLEVARHRLREANMDNCEFVAGDAYEVSRLWTRPVDSCFSRIPSTVFPIRHVLLVRSKTP
jgi:tRNA/tmRNA/rRNA uracil-C5-methylase (TrmA/RlmC/RlmD family)